ncbi:hypothetical protein C5167_047501 [Papaver somniferum]|uniref:Uncharacterized protein n=1 Tax=Papaver somniferum TaxID=3469 RepID=A0A4Y7LJ54_PAPSO|nr:hypothetical protein C5167_047501 [Papaver somniferum]
MNDFGSVCINFISPQASWRFHREHHFKQQYFSGRSLCRVIYAPFQGVEPLQRHFRSSSPLMR